MPTKFPLDDTTFGGTRAAIVLAKKLSELGNPYLVKKVSSYLTQHNVLVKEVMTISDPHARRALLEMVGDRIKAFNPKGWPETVATFTKNVAQSKVKRAKEENHGL